QLEGEPEQQHREQDPGQDGEPERRAGVHHRQHQECRQHHEFALCEIDGLRGLPQQREAHRHQGVDGAGGKPRNQKVEQIGHGFSRPSADNSHYSEARSPPSLRYDGGFPCLGQLSLGNTCLITCLPSTISTRKPCRSMSPFASNVASIRMPGSLAALMVSPCKLSAKAFESTLPIFSVVALIM